MVYRPDRELHRRAKLAVADVGSDLNAHVIGFLGWLVGDTDQLPARPAEAVPTRTGVDTSVDGLRNSPVSESRGVS